MERKGLRRMFGVLRAALLAAALPTYVLVAQEPAPGKGPGAEPLPQALEKPVFRVNRRDQLPEEKRALLAKYPNHPLVPLLEWAYTGLEEAKKFKDYSFTIVKRERVGATLLDPQYLFCKVRHEPFSVYTYFLRPADLKGQEAIYVAGKNDGKLIGHSPPHSLTYKLVGTVHLHPSGPIAMQGNRYPITSIGFVFLAEELIKNGEHDLAYGECEVKTIPGAKINGRTCTYIQVVHPTPRKEFRFHIAKIFVDEELNLPIRYEAWDWPKKAGGEPELIEEYTYLDLKFNNNFTDLDFDPKNPAYNYR